MLENNDIVTIGEGLIELSSSESLFVSNSFDKFYGGDTLCAGVAALRAGSSVCYITRLGNDHFGEYLLDAWQLEGLDTSQIKLCEGRNGIYFIAKNGPDKDISYYRTKTAAQKLSVEDIDFNYIKSSKLFYVTGYVQSLSLSCAEVVREMFDFSKKNGILTAYDINFIQGVVDKEEAKEHFEAIKNYVDILFLDVKHDAKAIFDLDSHDKIYKHLSDIGIKTIVIKENGVAIHIYGKNVYFSLPFLDIKLADTTGAQSTFNGALLSFILQGYGVETAARMAYCAGAIQVQGIGAIKPIPKLEAIEKFYKEHYE